MNDVEIKRGDIWWVSLDPAQGSEIKKPRPCLILTSDTLNRLRKTVVVVPLSTAAKAYPPITVGIRCQKRFTVAVIDQVRAVAKHRLRARIESAYDDDMGIVAKAICEILEL